MWNPTARAEHSRASLRYGSDLTDAEWRLFEPYLPAPRRRGRRRRWSMRQIVEAIFYVLRSSCPWRLLPDSFPPWRTAYRWFSELRDALVFESLNYHLVQLDRVRVDREPCPSAAVIDSESVKTTEAGGPRGYDAGKNGLQRLLAIFKKIARLRHQPNFLTGSVEIRHNGPVRTSNGRCKLTSIAVMWLRNNKVKVSISTIYAKWPSDHSD